LDRESFHGGASGGGFGHNYSSSTTGISSAQPSASVNNSFQWIQDSYNLTNLASSSQNLNENQLKKAWDVSELFSAADWNNWFERFLIELIRESPSSFLRSCAVLAQAHFPLARELFQASFASCWKELCPENKDSLIEALLFALQADTFPSDILLVFLNLVEFMEHYVNPLPIEPHILAGLAEKSLAFAKALHYRELEFQTSPASCFESLIHINKKLNIYDGAMGVLRKVQKMNVHKEKTKLKEDMLMSLEKWTEALEVYEKKLEVAPFNKSALMNKIKCLTSMGRWEDALEILTQRADFLGISSKKVRGC
jgi:serine/threonine-protein kinase mTOR